MISDALSIDISRMGQMINVYKLLLGKPDGKRLLGRPRGGWEDNIGMHLTEINGKVWIGCIWIRIGTSGGPL
jgi:hypothetical protein